MGDKAEKLVPEAGKTEVGAPKVSTVTPESVPSDAPATVLSDSAIRFQESRNVAQFLELLKAKGVHLKEAN